MSLNEKESVIILSQASEYDLIGEMFWWSQYFDFYGDMCACVSAQTGVFMNVCIYSRMLFVLSTSL